MTRESSTSLHGKVALVTGVTRSAGIGQAIARELAAAGCNLFLSFFRPYDRRQPWGVGDEEPKSLMTELLASRVEVGSSEVDLSKPDSPADLFRDARERFGRVDILVNNAAYSLSGEIDSLTAEDLDRHYAVNLRAAALLCREFVSHHRPGNAACIVNLTAGQGITPMPGELAYAATKGALDALTTTLAAEVASKGIRVNAVDPGPTDTGWIVKEQRRSLEEGAPMGRLGQPRDAARLVLFLASPASGWITGQIIRSRGGF